MSNCSQTSSNVFTNSKRTAIEAGFSMGGGRLELLCMGKKEGHREEVELVLLYEGGRLVLLCGCGRLELLCRDEGPVPRPSLQGVDAQTFSVGEEGGP